MSWHVPRPSDSAESTKPPTAPTAATGDPWLMWKIAGGILIALFAWRAFEVYQQRLAMQEFARQMREITKPGADPMGLLASIERQRQAEAARRAAASRANSPTTTRPGPRRLPASYRCLSGTLIYTAKDGAIRNITPQSDHWYCPPGGTAADCWKVTPAAVGCR